MPMIKQVTQVLIFLKTNLQSSKLTVSLIHSLVIPYRCAPRISQWGREEGG